MRNEWFYLRQWKAAAKPNWAVVSLTDAEIYKKNLTKWEAFDYSEEMRKTQKTGLRVMNMNDTIYNELNKKMESENDNSGSSRKTITG